MRTSYLNGPLLKGGPGLGNKTMPILTCFEIQWFFSRHLLIGWLFYNDPINVHTLFIIDRAFSKKQILILRTLQCRNWINHGLIENTFASMTSIITFRFLQYINVFCLIDILPIWNRLIYYYVTANFGYFKLIFAFGLKLHHPWGEDGGSFDTKVFIHISFSLFKCR